MEVISLIFETALAVLILIVVFYLKKLRNLLSKVSNVDDELRTAAADFDQGARSAEAALVNMNETAKMLCEQLRHATTLRDDLTFLSERGETLADRLDTLVRTVQAMEQMQKRKGTTLEPIVSTTGNQNKLSTPVARTLSQAERSLITTLLEQK